MKGSVPKTMWKSHAEFNKYNLATFRTHLYKLKQKYGGAIVQHVNTATTEEDSGGEDLINNLAPNLTPTKRRSSEIKSGKRHDDMSPYNNFILAPWFHPETGRKYTDAFILLPSRVTSNEQYSI